jgi:hypothetical protein
MWHDTRALVLGALEGTHPAARDIVQDAMLKLVTEKNVDPAKVERIDFHAGSNILNPIRYPVFGLVSEDQENNELIQAFLEHMRDVLADLSSSPYP